MAYSKRVRVGHVLGRYTEEGATKPDIVVWDKAKTPRTIWELDNICIIQVVVGATGLIKANLQNYLKFSFQQ